MITPNEDKKRLKIYFVKTPCGNIAACTRTNHLLITDYTPQCKEKIESLLELMIEKDPRYNGCTISAMGEIDE